MCFLRITVYNIIYYINYIYILYLYRLDTLIYTLSDSRAGPHTCVRYYNLGTLTSCLLTLTTVFYFWRTHTYMRLHMHDTGTQMHKHVIKYDLKLFFNERKCITCDIFNNGLLFLVCFVFFSFLFCHNLFWVIFIFILYS